MFYHDPETAQGGREVGRVVGPANRRVTERREGAAMQAPRNGSMTTQATAFTEAPLCKYFASRSCIYGDRCKNRHTSPEANEVTPCELCKFYLAGFCKNGNSCRFLHDAAPAISAAPLAISVQLPVRNYLMFSEYRCTWQYRVPGDFVLTNKRFPSKRSATGPTRSWWWDPPEYYLALALQSSS